MRAATVCFTYMTHTKAASSLIGFLLIALFALPVLAKGPDVDASASAGVDVNAGLPMRPLDIIKARAKQIQQGVQLPLKASATSSVRVQINEERRASSTNNRSGVQALVRFHGGEIRNRFRLAITHLTNLINRIDSRLQKMEDAGVDTSATLQIEADARTAVDKASVDAKAIADFVATANDSTDRSAFKAELQAKLKTAQESVKAAHAAVLKLVRALVQLAKDNKVKLEVDAAVSASTTVQ